MIDRLIAALNREIWLRDTYALGRVHAFFVRLLRLGWAVLRDLTDGQLSMRAMSLVYTTLLSLVPLLAFSFSVLKAFGVHNQIEPVLQGFLAPFGERATDLTSNIIGFVDNVNVGLLGSVGLLILVYIVVSLVQKIENGFNFVWRVPQARSFTSRFSGYLSVLTIGPVLVVGAISLLGVARSQVALDWLIAKEPFGTVFVWLTGFMPMFLVALACTFFYILIPNTKVRLLPAAGGGLVAGFLWDTIGGLFATFIVSSNSYTAIYAGFAAPLLFMFWIYLSWLILLIGTQVAFYLQNPQFIAAHRGTQNLEHAFKEHLALSVMYLVARHFRGVGPRWNFDGMSRHLHVNAEPLRTVIDRLLQRGLLSETSESGMFAPGRALDTILLFDIVDAVRHGSGLAGRGGMDGKELPAVDAVQDQLDAAIRDTLGERTLDDLVRDGEGKRGA